MKTPAQVAELIKDDVNKQFSSSVDPDAQHLHKAAVAVCKELDMEPNFFNVGHVMEQIKEHVSAPTRAYPRMKYSKNPPKDFPHPVEYVPALEVYQTVVENEEMEDEIGGDWSDSHTDLGKPTRKK